MATIGNNVIGASTLAFDSTSAAIMTRDSPNLYGHVGVAGEAVNEFYVYGQGASAGSVEVGIFSVDAGETEEVLVATAVINFTTALQWHSVTGLNLALTEGVNYRVAMAAPSVGFTLYYIDAVTGGAYSLRDGAGPATELDNSYPTNINQNRAYCLYAVTSTGGAAVPDISSVSGNNAEGTVTFNGSNFTGLTAATYAGQALANLTVVNDGQATATMPAGGAAYNSQNNFVLTNGDGNSDPFAATFNPPAGMDHVDIAGESGAFPSDSIFSEVAGLTAGPPADQFAADDLLPGGYDWSFDGNGIVTMPPGVPAGTYPVNVRFLDASASYAVTADTLDVVWDGDAPVMPADDSPAIDENTTAVGSYAALSGEAPISYTLSGTDAALLTVDASGDLSFLSAPDFENPLDADTDNIYQVTITGTNAAGSDSVNITIQVDNVADDSVPDAFSFTDSTGARGEVVESDVVTITGIDTPAAVTIGITGGEYSIDGGAYTSSPGSISNGQTLQLRTTASMTDGALASVLVTVGGVSDTWTVATTDIAPAVQSIIVRSDGRQVALGLSEDCNFGAGGSGGFTINMSGGPVSLTYLSQVGSDSILYQANRVIVQGETGTGDYTQPGDGIEDLTGNDLPSFADVAVTNNSAQTISLVSIGGDNIVSPGETATLVTAGIPLTDIKYIVLIDDQDNEYEVKFNGTDQIKIPSFAPAGAYQVAARSIFG